MAKTKPKFDWDKWLENEDVAVHCETKRESDRFAELAYQHGNRIPSHCYEVEKERTVYFSDDSYCDIDYANRKGYEIFKFSSYDFE